MKKSKKFIAIIISILFLNSCGTLKEGFTSQKKDSIDEFLVQKKSPLVLPPDFSELPLPNVNSQLPQSVEEKDLKSLISNNKDSDKSNQNNLNENKNFENSIIEKIKNN